MAFLLTFSGGGSATYKDAVRVASTANLALSGSTPLTIDGVTLADKERVLLKDQTTQSQNGIYEVSISGGSYSLARAKDADTDKEVLPGMIVPVAEGTLHADKIYQLLTNAPIVVGTTALVFSDVLIGLANKADRNLGNLTSPTALNQVLLGQDGTAAAPAYSFTSDPDTGVYRSAANTVALAAGGVRALSVLQNGGNYTMLLGAGDSGSKAEIFTGSQSTSFRGINNTGFTTTNTADFQLNTTTTLFSSDSPIVHANSLFGGILFFGGSIGRNQWGRPAQIAARHGISVNSPASSPSQGMGMLGAQGVPAFQSGQTTSANASTTLTFSTTGGGSICGFIGIGDRIYLNGLSGTKATVTGITGANTVVVDTALGDGVARTPWIERPLLNLYTQGGTRVFHVDYDGNTQINGGLRVKSIHNQTGTADVITVSVNDYYIGINSSGAPVGITVNLPAAATAGAGKQYVFKDENGSAATKPITLTPNGAELIDGAATYVMAVNRESVTVVCDGTGWQII